MKKLSLLTMSLQSLLLLTGCNENSSNFVSSVKQPRSEIRTTREINPDFSQFMVDDSTIKPEQLRHLTKIAPTKSSSDLTYVSTERSYDPSVTFYNGMSLGENGAATVFISGKHLVIEKNHPQRILEKLENRFNIKKVVFEAETIELRGTLAVPGATIEMRTEHLQIGKNGKIVTTPMSNLLYPQQFAAGHAGQKGGDLFLFIEKLTLPTNPTVIFTLDGAKGQRGGVGKNGLSGKSVKTISGSLIYEQSYRRECNRESGRPICHNRGGSRGVAIWPTNGTNAIAGGMPGIGGAGGDIYSSLAISSNLFSMSGGLSGDLPEKSIGGAAGNPKRGIHRIDGRVTTRTTLKGADAQVVLNGSNVGSVGTLVVKADMGEWLGVRSLKEMNKFAEDLYIANNFLGAQASFQKNSKLISNSKNSTNFAAEKLHAVTSLYQLTNHLDFYGHSATWTPALSLETNYRVFTSDKESLLKTLYLTYWLSHTKNSLVDKYSALKQLAHLKQVKFTKSQTKLNKITMTLPELQHDIAEVTLREKRIGAELIEIENQIKAEAQNELKTSGLLKAVRALGAIATVIPAGQPVLGAIGSGISIISSAIEGDSPVSTILSAGPGLYDSFKGDAFERSARDWNKKWGAVNLSNLNNAQTTQEKLKYASDVIKFSTPIIKELDIQIELLSTNEVPRSELDKKMNEIKKSHPRFNSLIGQLRQLLHNKRKLATKIQFFKQQWGSLSVELSSDIVEFIKLQAMQDRLDIGGNLIITGVLDELERSAKLQLQRYSYYLVKAFEYRFLSSYEHSIDLVGLNESFERMVRVNQDAYLSDAQFSSLMHSYEYIISEIKQRVSNSASDGDLRRDDRIYLQLNAAEIYELNKKGSVEVNLLGQRVFTEQQENIRLNNLNVSNFNVESDSAVELQIERIGDHYLEKNDIFYAFSGSQKNGLWIFKQDELTEEFYMIGASEHESNLISELFDMSSSNTFMRVGARARYKISTKHVGEYLEVKGVELKLDCDFEYHR